MKLNELWPLPRNPRIPTKPKSAPLIVRTVLSVFEHCVLLQVNDGDTLILGSNQPLSPQSAGLTAIQKQIESLPKVRDDLERQFGTFDVRTLLLTHLRLDRVGLAKLAASENGGLNTDANMRLAFDAPKRLFRTSRNPVSRWIMQGVNPQLHIDCFNRWGCRREHNQTLQVLHQHMGKSKCTTAAVSLVHLVLATDPANSYFMAESILNSVEEGAKLDTEALSLLANRSPSQTNRIGVAFWRQGSYVQAITIFEELTRLYPQSQLAWQNLATNYEAIGNRSDEAYEAYRKANAADPCQARPHMLDEVEDLSQNSVSSR